jgi:type I restriction enzyme M protein
MKIEIDVIKNSDYLVDIHSNALKASNELSRQQCKLWMKYYHDLCSRMVVILKSHEATDDDIEDLSDDDIALVKSAVGYFIEPKHLYSSWLDLGVDFDYSNVNIAIRSFELFNPEILNDGYSSMFDIMEKNIKLLSGMSFGDRSREVCALLYSALE